MTTWIGPCAYCAAPFTAPTPREHCTPRCRDLHRWYGVVPDAHRKYAARTTTTPSKEL